MKVGPMRLGPFCAPLASAPWQRTHDAAWNNESPSAIIAVVTPAGKPPLVALAVVVAPLCADAGVGADDVVAEPEEQAAIAVAAISINVGRAKELRIRIDNVRKECW